MNLLTDTDVWRALEQAWDGKLRHCAVAYLSNPALRFSEGDVLIVDASDEAIKGGQTSAAALRAAFGSGADVYSWPGLHAKVYVLGAEVFVGSANASQNSKGLMEAVVRTNDLGVVAQAIAFVDALARKADKVDEAFLVRIEAIRVAPRLGGASSKPLDVRTQRTWLVGVAWEDLTDESESHVADSEDLQKSLEDDEAAGWFTFDMRRSRFFRDAAPGDTVVVIERPSVNSETAKDVEVFPPAVMVKLGDASDGRVVHTVSRADDQERSLTWKQFLKLIADAGWSATPTLQGTREIPPKVAARLQRLWPELD